MEPSWRAAGCDARPIGVHFASLPAMRGASLVDRLELMTGAERPLSAHNRRAVPSAQRPLSRTAAMFGNERKRARTGRRRTPILADCRMTALETMAVKSRHSFSIDPADLLRAVPLVRVRPDRAKSGLLLAPFPPARTTRRGQSRFSEFRETRLAETPAIYGKTHSGTIGRDTRRVPRICAARRNKWPQRTSSDDVSGLPAM